jgi:hypothetical protein
MADVHVCVFIRLRHEGGARGILVSVNGGDVVLPWWLSRKSTRLGVVLKLELDVPHEATGSASRLVGRNLRHSQIS